MPMHARMMWKPRLEPIWTRAGITCPDCTANPVSMVPSLPPLGPRGGDSLPGAAAGNPAMRRRATLSERQGSARLHDQPCRARRAGADSVSPHLQHVQLTIFRARERQLSPLPTRIALSYLMF